MWQRFTERARRVILLGQEEAGRMQSGYVGTEHLLLGLVREHEGAAAQILQKMGISLPKVRRAIDAEVQPGDFAEMRGEPKLTPKAKRVLELAADEARRMRHNYIGTEHLLLGLLREKDGLAATVLRSLGLDLARARAQVMEYLGPDAPQTTEDSPPIVSNAANFRGGDQIERILRAFVRNLNSGLAFPDNLKLVFGARMGYFGANEWADNWNFNRLRRQIRISSLNIDLIEGEDAQAKIFYRVETAVESKSPVVLATYAGGWTEIVALKGSTDAAGAHFWQIVPPDEFPISHSVLEPPLLAEAAFALSQQVPQATPQSLSRVSLHHLQQLAMAAIQFASDWQDTFAFAPQYLPEALADYLVSAGVFLIPGTAESYAFNAHLSGKTLEQITQPAQTVLFYEGEGDELTFRYDGQAALAFVDGHCALIAPDEVKNLIWQP